MILCQIKLVDTCESNFGNVLKASAIFLLKVGIDLMMYLPPKPITAIPIPATIAVVAC